MKFAITLLIGMISFAGNSQTDIIEYRSHNGNMSSYTSNSVISIDGISTNFGMVAMPQINIASLDTVKFLDDGKAVMVTSEYCYGPNSTRPINVLINEEEGIVKPKENLWRAGSDTMLNHPLFSQQHSLDSIKAVLQGTYNFQNPIEDVIFIGYDNLNEQKVNDENSEEEDIKQNTIEPKQNGGYGMGILIAILLPVLLVYISGPLLFGWMKRS